MTYLPKSELVGVLSPYSINTKDIGNNWRVITDNPFLEAIVYLGNGIVAGGFDDFFRSTDYGNTWINLGDPGIQSYITRMTYLGNGIVLAIDLWGSVFRSTDYGLTWTKVVDSGGVQGNRHSLSNYFGNGIVLSNLTFTSGPPFNYHLWRSTDFGATWADIATFPDNYFITDIHYFDNGIGIALIVDSPGTTSRIYRSTDYGATWADVGVAINGRLNSTMYLGNGIVIVENWLGNLHRSNNYGLTWTDLGVITGGNSYGSQQIANIKYVGNGVVVIGDEFGHIWRSTDFGLTWADLGDITGIVSEIVCIEYLGNGIIIADDWDLDVFRSDVSYKIDEAQVNYPRIPVDVTASRALSPSEYTNLDQTRSLLVYASCNCQGGANAGSTATFQLVADTASPPVTDASPLVGINAGLANEDNIYQTTGVVRPGYNYSIVPFTTDTGTVTLVDWFEMYI